MVESIVLGILVDRRIGMAASFWAFIRSKSGRSFRTLHQLELDDWARHGKVRQRWEKELRDPDDMFILAEERRKLLAKQRRKH